MRYKIRKFWWLADRVLCGWVYKYACSTISARALVMIITPGDDGVFPHSSSLLSHALAIYVSLHYVWSLNGKNKSVTHRINEISSCEKYRKKIVLCAEKLAVRTTCVSRVYIPSQRPNTNRREDCSVMCATNHTLDIWKTPIANDELGRLRKYFKNQNAVKFEMAIRNRICCRLLNWPPLGKYRDAADFIWKKKIELGYGSSPAGSLLLIGRSTPYFRVVGVTLG